MIILGIDPGTTRIGYAIIKKDKGPVPELVDCGILKVKSKEKNERIKEAAEQLGLLLKKYNPNLVAIEKLFFVKNQKTGMAVAEMRGALIQKTGGEKIPIIEYAPTEIKKSITGNGNADKKAVGKMVEILLKKKIIGPDDIRDAIATALTAAHDIRQKEIYLRTT